MKRYWIAGLLVLTLLLSLLTGCGSKKQENTEEETLQPQVQEDPDTLVCCNGTTTLRFHKEDDKWVWFDDTDFPLDQSYVQTLLDTLQSLRELTPITLTGELADYGLESVKSYVMLSDKSGNESYIYLGKKTDNGYYMFDGAPEDGVYVAPAALLDQISRSIYDMALLPSFPQLTLDDIEALDVTCGEKELHLTVKGGAWYDSGADVTANMADVTDALSRLAVTSCVDYRPASGAPAICGLTDGAAVLKVTYGGEKTLTLTIGAQRNSDGYFAQMNEDTTIYLLPAELAKPLLTLAKG